MEALSDERHEHLDQLLSLQKLMLQSIGDPEETPPFTQVRLGYVQQSYAIHVLAVFLLCFKKDV